MCSDNTECSNGKTVALYTLGCKVNQYDTEAIAESFRAKGFQVVPFSEKADVYVINTCAVTARSASKARQSIRRAKRRNPSSVIVVAGCYSQVYPNEVVSLGNADIVAGIGERARLAEFVSEFFTNCKKKYRVQPLPKGMRYEETQTETSIRTRALVKIQEGCDEFCTYCIVPYARGPIRSRDPENVVCEIQNLAKAGFKEVVLTGINLGKYGLDLPDGFDLAEILKLIHQVQGIERIRLSSLEPMHFSERLLQVITNCNKVCPHFHIPLQSASIGVLKKMGRRYSPGEFHNLITEIKKRVPNVAITTDVMVGFPGENDSDFLETVQFVQREGFYRLHVFKYSRRKGTKAYELAEEVPAATKAERSRILKEVGDHLLEQYVKRFMGDELEVLVETERNAKGALQGLTRNYIRVYMDGDDHHKQNLVQVRLIRPYEDGAWGVLLEE